MQDVLKQPDTRTLIVRADSFKKMQWGYLKSRQPSVHSAIRREVRKFGPKRVRIAISLEGAPNKMDLFSTSVNED